MMLALWYQFGMMLQFELTNFTNVRLFQGEKKKTSSSNVSFVQGELYNQVFHLLMSMADEVQCGTALAEGWAA